MLIPSPQMRDTSTISIQINFRQLRDSDTQRVPNTS